MRQYVSREKEDILKRFFSVAILITGLWLLTACGSEPVSSELSIGSGVPLDGPSTSLVRIASKNLSICTGVLVANDLVVTAAHCLKSEDPSTYSVIFPANMTDRTRSVVEFQRVREDTLVFFPNFDLAWIRLNSPAPVPYVPATLLGDTAKIKEETALTLVGTANETPCHPRDQICTLVKLSVRLVRSWSSPHLINLSVVDSLAVTSSSGTCPGDSGGPSFVSYQGQDLLFGIVAGKDPIFTGGVSTACGSPRSVLTRIGEYQEWIEASSGRTLKVVDPSENKISLDFLASPSVSDTNLGTWQEWFLNPLPSDTAWTTVHKILEQAVLEFQGRMTPDQISQLFQTGGQEWIEQITSLRSLTLGFPDQSVAVEDLRPLVGLKNLADLSFLSRSYKGLDVLGRMPQLKSLSIVGRVAAPPEQGQFMWNQLASPHLETLRLSQVLSANVEALRWKNLPNLKSLIVVSPLGKIQSSILREEDLMQLVSLQLQEFSCAQVQWPKQPLPNLKTLLLRTTASLAQSEVSCINWDLLPNLTELDIQGYRIGIPQFTARMPARLAAQLRR